MTQGQAGGVHIGLVGCGAWGRHILCDLLGLGCKVTVAVRSEEHGRYAAEHGASAVVKSGADLPAVDGLVVATPISTHAAVVGELLLRNVPIFCEKPITADRASARYLATMAPTRLFVMDKWRYHPGIEALRDIARSGELGPVHGLRTTRVGWGFTHSEDATWVLIPHELSVALEILGSVPRPKSALVDQVDGRAAGVVGTFGDSPWLVSEVSVRHPDRRREVRLYCRDGVAVLDDPYRDHVLIAWNGDLVGGVRPIVEQRPISTEFPLLRELRAFVEHLNGGPPPRSSALEGLAVVEAIADLRVLAGLDPVPASSC